MVSKMEAIMMIATFDTLKYFERLTTAGVPEAQAKAQVEVIREVIEDRLATKRDFKELEAAIKRDMKELEVAVKRDMKELESRLETKIKELEASLKHDMKELELRITTRFGAMIGAAVAILAALIAFIK